MTALLFRWKVHKSYGRDSKYYIIEKHPEHNNWVKEQNNKKSNKNNNKNNKHDNGKNKK
ncbi:MAG: hypothetical protein MUP82_09430 [Candidatus Marinimicrobia bacterium]|nr:hypothetical protein [Candidatus Neomarinimicrobiota bacterium]